MPCRVATTCKKTAQIVTFLLRVRETTMPHLAKIWIYPIKSLDGVEVPQAAVLPGGALAHDREFAIFDQQGKVVNGKRTARIQQIRSTFDLLQRIVTLSADHASQQFHLDADRPAIADWLSQYLGYQVTLQQNLHMGFPDDTEASGPTIVSTATLKTVQTWFPDLTLDEIRHRFRTNLEIEDAPAFWEDHLFGEAGQLIPFQIGTIQCLGSNPCQRCVVPTRHSRTGDPDASFQKTFIRQRQANLPPQVHRSRFNHFYRLTLNTKIPATEAGKILAIGDEVRWSHG